MNKKFFIGLKVCNYYAVHIIDEGYAFKETVKEDDLAGFIQCLRFLGYIESYV